MMIQTFQPFTDRLSRDIRNLMSRSLVEVVESRTLAPAHHVAEQFIAPTLADCYHQYIESRLKRYGHVLDDLMPAYTPMELAILLWDEGLFFEVHEVLEHAWLESHGEEKLFYQAMIRAAGVWVKLEHGYRETALSMAAKALQVLLAQRDRLARYTDPELLITALHDPGQPPKLRVQTSSAS